MEYELYHYGVKGMKWGIRRYQNADGTLTSAGRKRARKEYQEDNKTAYELGKNATILGRSAARSMNRTIKLENRLNKRLEKDGEQGSKGANRLGKKWLASAKTTQQLTESYMTMKAKAEAHCKSLVDKYGEEAVSGIKYKDVKLRKGDYSTDKFTTINERTNKLSDYATAGAASIASLGASALMGAPVTLIFSPKTTWEKAYETEQIAYYTNLRNMRGRG